MSPLGIHHYGHETALVVIALNLPKNTKKGHKCSHKSEARAQIANSFGFSNILKKLYITFRNRLVRGTFDVNSKL